MSESGSNTKTYTITYDANGGTGAPSGQEKAHDSVLTLSTSQPSRSGYTFLGWASSSVASSPAYYAGDPYEQNADITLYAVWKKGNPAFLFSTPSQWAQDEIIEAYNMDLIPEYMMQDYTLSSTRMDFVRLAFSAIENKCGSMQQVLYNKGLIDNMERDPSVVFVDVSERLGYDNSDRYQVAALRALGIIKGVSDQRFEPNRTITRQEAATLLSRVHSFVCWGESESFPYIGTEYKYADNNLISNWAYDGVYNMRALEVMNGIGNDMFNPQGTYTIEQSIATIVRLLRKCSRE